MIYFVSDLHEDIKIRGFSEYVEKAEPDDLLIILGDVGLNFRNTEQSRKFTELFLASGKNIAIIDGNHENFDFLYSFPEEECFGGKVGRLTEKIVHLKRGNIYEINGKTFFVFGGCKSSAKWKEQGLWYPEEEASDAELELAYKSLKEHGMSVDYILTHKYEQDSADGDNLQKLTRFIDENVSYKKWYSGHWHENRIIDEKHVIVYDLLTSLE